MIVLFVLSSVLMIYNVFPRYILYDSTHLAGMNGQSANVQYIVIGPSGMFRDVWDVCRYFCVQEPARQGQTVAIFGPVWNSGVFPTPAWSYLV